MHVHTFAHVGKLIINVNFSYVLVLILFFYLTEIELIPVISQDGFTGEERQDFHVVVKNNTKSPGSKDPAAEDLPESPVPTDDDVPVPPTDEIITVNNDDDSVTPNVPPTLPVKTSVQSPSMFLYWLF